MARASSKPAAASAFRRATDAAFHEVDANEPASVTRSGKTGAAKRSMLTAIALSKARAAMKRKGR